MIKAAFCDDDDTVLKELPADMIDQLKTYQKKSDMARITGVDDGKEEWYSTYA